MTRASAYALLLSALVLALAQGQRITTIQLDGVQYFVSRMNPYSPELNYFLAYQYCRSLGLQLTSFESKEKSESITQYLRNAGYNQYDFWTSGNRLGTDMFLWMSTGLPFNATFDLLSQPGDAPSGSPPPATPETMVIEPTMLRRMGSARQSKSGPSSGCVALKAPDLRWAVDDCAAVKDFICEQTRCYYYNYGSIPVSSSQGRFNKDKPVAASSTTSTSTTTTTTSTTPASTPAAEAAEAVADAEHQQVYDTGNEVPAEDVAPTHVPEDAAEDESQPDNSVMGQVALGQATPTEEVATDSPAVTGRARGKFLEQPAGGAGLGWGWPANIKLEIPVPRKVGAGGAH